MSSTQLLNEVRSSPDELKSIVQQGYDECASKYTSWQTSRGVPQLISDRLSKLFAHLRPKAIVLELGCGPGIPCTKLLVEHELDLNITAVDFSASQISLAHERISSPRLDFLHSDMTKLEYPESKFDAVVAFYSFFHLPREEQGPMVKKITNWLKPGGILLMNMNSEEGDVVMDKWMGVKMFSAGLGVEGNLAMLKEYGEGLEVEAELVGETLGLQKELFFHWIWAVKRGNNSDRLVTHL